MKNDMKALLFPALAVMSLQTAASAQSYECTFKNEQTRGWISETAYYTIDAAKGTAIALDGHIYSVHKQPIPAGLKKKSNGKLQLNWELDGLTSVNRSSKGERSVKVYYTAVFDPATHSANVGAKFRGAVNSHAAVFARGACKLEQR